MANEDNSQSLPQGWVLLKLGDIVLGRSKSIIPNNYPEDLFELYSIPSHSAGKPEIVRGKDIGSSKQIVNEGMVLLSKINPRLNRSWVVGKFSPHRQIASSEWIVFPKMNNVEAKYLHYYLNTNEFRDFLSMRASGVGGSLMRVKPDTLRNYPFPLPSIAEQRRISTKIETLFSQLDIISSAVSTVESKILRAIESIIEEGFNGNLTKQYRKQQREEGAEQQLNLLLMKRKERMDHDKLIHYKDPVFPETDLLPQLPNGWIWVSPEQISSADAHSLGIGPFGSNLLVSDYVQNGVPLIFVRNIRTCNFSGKDSKYISFEKSQELHAHKVNPGDLLITKMGDPPGDVCIYPESAETAIITSDCIRWALNPLIGDKKFFLYSFRSRLVKDQIIKITRGVAQQKISLDRFRKIAIPFPPEEERAIISKIIENRIGVLNAISKEVLLINKSLGQTRDSILRCAFTGKLVPQNPDEESTSFLQE